MDTSLNRPAHLPNEPSEDKPSSLFTSLTGKQAFTPSIQLTAGEILHKNDVHELLSPLVDYGVYLGEINNALDALYEKISRQMALNAFSSDDQLRFQNYLIERLVQLKARLAGIRTEFVFDYQKSTGDLYQAFASLKGIPAMFVCLRSVLDEVVGLQCLAQGIQESLEGIQDCRKYIDNLIPRLEDLNHRSSQISFQSEKEMGEEVSFESVSKMRTVTLEQKGLNQQRDKIKNRIERKERTIQRRQDEVQVITDAVSRYLNAVEHGSESGSLMDQPELKPFLSSIQQSTEIQDAILFIFHKKLKFFFTVNTVKGDLSEKDSLKGTELSDLEPDIVQDIPVVMQQSRFLIIRLLFRFPSFIRGRLIGLLSKKIMNSENFKIGVKTDFNGISDDPNLQDKPWSFLKKKVLKSPFFQTVFFDSRKELIHFLKKNKFNDFDHFRAWVEDQYFNRQKIDLFVLSAIKKAVLAGSSLEAEQISDTHIKIGISPDFNSELNKLFGKVSAYFDIITADDQCNHAKTVSFRNKPYAILTNDECDNSAMKLTIEIIVIDRWRFTYTSVFALGLGTQAVFNPVEASSSSKG